MKEAKLIPPDYKRCQAEYKSGSFMTLGPRSWVRCENQPHWLVEETKAAGDGLKGSMTVCDDCAKRLVEQRADDPDSYTLEWIGEWLERRKGVKP